MDRITPTYPLTELEDRTGTGTVDPADLYAPRRPCPSCGYTPAADDGLLTAHEDLLIEWASGANLTSDNDDERDEAIALVHAAITIMTVALAEHHCSRFCPGRTDLTELRDAFISSLYSAHHNLTD